MSLCVCTEHYFKYEKAVMVFLLFFFFPEIPVAVKCSCAKS